MELALQISGMFNQEGVQVGLNASQQLVELCKSGDRKAQYAIYKQYSKAMYNLCLRILNDEDDAQDVLQEAFLNAFTNINSYRGDSAFGAWLKRIVVNTAINHGRKRKMELVPIEKARSFEADEKEGRLDEQELNLQVEVVRKAIQKLPDGFRVVFSLYLLEGYDHAEIGEILGISESTSKSQYNRAKKKLREILGLKND